MEFNFVTIGLTIVNLLILMAILKHFLFEKVEKVIDDRNNNVIETINKANSDREEAKSLKIETQKKLEESKQKGKAIVEEYKGKAEKLSDDIKSEASLEVQHIRERSLKDIERQKEKAKSEIKEQVVDLAVLVSSKALEGSIDEEQHRKLIKDFISKVGI